MKNERLIMGKKKASRFFSCGKAGKNEKGVMAEFILETSYPTPNLY